MGTRSTICARWQISGTSGWPADAWSGRRSDEVTSSYRLAVIAGDGIGPEVIPEGLAALRRAAEVTGSFSFTTVDYPWSCTWYLEHGAMMPPDGLAQLADSDAIYLGAVGLP